MDAIPKSSAKDCSKVVIYASTQKKAHIYYSHRVS